MSVNKTETIGLRQAVDLGTPKALELWLDVVADPEERARELAGLPKPDRARMGTLLEPATAAQLFDSVDPELAAKVVKAIPSDGAAALLGDLDTPTTVALLRRLDDEVADAVLSATEHDRAQLLRSQLSWPKDSVAAYMEPRAFTVSPEHTAAQAIDQLREHVAAAGSDDQCGEGIFATDDAGVLLGVVSLRDLALAPADHLVSNMLERDPVTVTPLTDAEDAASLLIDRKLDELPVIDAEGRLLGVLWEEDAFDIVERETTEDAEKQGGSEPLDVPYLRATPWQLWRKRIVWLLVLFIAEAYTGTVLRAFEEEMEAVVALAFFIPLLIGTGGNTGTQITTTLVRAMGKGQVRFRDLPAIVTKEMSTGFLIALAMATAAMIRAWTLGVGPEVTLTVCLTVAAIVLWSSLISSLLPLLLKKVKVDPAVVSAPMIATIVDGTGLMIYFWIAHLTLPQLAGL